MIFRKFFGRFNLKIKTKLLAVLLMLVFIASVGSAVAEDVASEEISVFQDVEKIAVDEQTAPVEQTEDETLLADAEDESGD